MRGSDKDAAKEAQEQKTGGAQDESEGSKGKREAKAAAAAGAQATTTAEENNTTVVAGGDCEDGDDLSGADAAAAAVSSATPEPSQAGKEAVAVHEGRGPEEEVERGGAKDSQAASREGGGGHGQADGENLEGGQDREEGTVSSEARDNEAEAAEEQVPRAPATFARLLSSTHSRFFVNGCEQGEFSASSPEYRGHLRMSSYVSTAVLQPRLLSGFFLFCPLTVSRVASMMARCAEHHFSCYLLRLVEQQMTFSMACCVY